MKAALDQSRVDRLLKLLNEDETAAKLWQRMDGEIYQSVESTAEEFGLSMEGIDVYDNAPWISFFAGQWAERVRNELKGPIWVYADDRQRSLTVREIPTEVAWLAQHGRLGDVRRC